MADCASIPSCTCGLFRRSRSKANLRTPQTVNARLLRREIKSFRKQLPSLKVHDVSAPFTTAVGGSQSLDRSSLKCFCLGAVMDPGNITPASWMSYADEALLLVSVIFAYMAGAIPRRAIPGARSNNTDQDHPASSTIPCGRSLGNDTEYDAESRPNDSWGAVKGKLLDALTTNEHANSFHNKAEESDIGSKTRPLSLFALAEGPRLRLLSATVQQLQKEVSDISRTYEVVNPDDWLMIASEVIKGTIQPACTKWLEEEIALEIGDSETTVTRISEKLKVDDTVLQNIDRSGKAELYADLLFFIRFGCLRTACCYDPKFLTQHGIDILEDVVIMLADGIASFCLELISVDSNMSTEINATGLTLCDLSTRELQKLRNEVALKQWLLQNFESVVSMYEDRFEIFVLCRQNQEDPLEHQSGKYTWWKKFTFTKAATLPSFTCVLINPVSLQVKRTKELRALTGWRYYFSLLLEFSDITMPLVKTVFTNVSNAVAFFLVHMIGRSLGLIFSGIRQSLGWR